MILTTLRAISWSNVDLIEVVPFAHAFTLLPFGEIPWVEDLFPGAELVRPKCVTFVTCGTKQPQKDHKIFTSLPLSREACFS